MVSADTARTAVGIIGNVIALMLFLSPVPTFIRIWKKGAVEQFSPIPYLATLVNCGLWVLYGLPMVTPHSILVITINGAGLGIEIVYLTLYFIFCDRKMKIKVILVVIAEAIFLGVLVVIVFTAIHSVKLRSTVVGSICIVANVMMYAAPLSVMKLVITTKSVEYMPFFLSLASFLNGISWSIYALIRFDPYIIAPNGLGTLFGLAQLILYAAFYKSTQRQKAARQGKIEMGLSEPEHTAKIGGAQKVRASEISGP